jgi:P-type Mg2+ transporter
MTRARIANLALRTRLPFIRSRPSRTMLAVTAVVILITLWLLYSPLAGLLGFVPLPPPFLLVIFVIVALYFMSAELTKRWFYGQAKTTASHQQPLKLQRAHLRSVYRLGIRGTGRALPMWGA